MIIDNQNLFDNALAVTATATSTNVIDLGTFRDLGVGDDPALEVWVQVTTAFVSAGGATLQIQFQGSRDNSSYTTMAESRAYAVADLTAGKFLLPITVPRPQGIQLIPRYYRMNYIVAVSTFSAGVLWSGLLVDRADDMTQLGGGYPAGVVITT